MTCLRAIVVSICAFPFIVEIKKTKELFDFDFVNDFSTALLGA